ncbi:MAG: hypothetical protein WCJ18_07425, partial [Planctomycetota bacterium]
RSRADSTRPSAAETTLGRALVVIPAVPREAPAAAGPRQPFPPAKESAAADSRLSPTLEGFEFEGLDPPSA